MKQVEFYYDYGSPIHDLACTQLPALCDRRGAELINRPILLGGIFKSVGNDTPVNVAPKATWMFDDIARHAAHYGVPFEKNPHFVFNTLPVMRGAIWADSQGNLERYIQAMFEAAWVNGVNLADGEAIGEVLQDAGIDRAALEIAIQEGAVKKALIDATDQAVARGAFDAPAIFVDGTMHFGQDRLTWVERALVT
jgi:2-hydroxychromene-2-carboxylate isomerase